MENKPVTTYSQPTASPTAKVSAVAGAGIVVGLVVTLLAQFGVIVPDGVSEGAAAAFAGIITIITFVQALIQFLAGYMKKSEKK